MFKGSIVALVTPFTENDLIDVEALKALVNWHVDAGTDAIMCLGTTAETPTLMDEERRLVVGIVMEEVRGRVPVIAGTGCNATAKAVAYTREAKEWGVEGCLVVVPYYNRPTFEGCVRHFEEVAKVGLPMIAYHHPARTGVKLNIQTLLQIAQIENVVAIKEASGDMELAVELCAQVNVLCGDDVIALPMLAAGAKGVCSIVANVIPEKWKELVTSMSRELAQELLPLCKAMVLEVNPQCVKYALSVMGKCKPYMRLPLLEPREEAKKKIELAIVQQSEVRA